MYKLTTNSLNLLLNEQYANSMYIDAENHCRMQSNAGICTTCTYGTYENLATFGSSYEARIMQTKIKSRCIYYATWQILHNSSLAHNRSSNLIFSCSTEMLNTFRREFNANATDSG